MRIKIFLVFIILIFNSCKNQDDLKDLKYTQIHLKWNKAYKDDTIDKSLLGLKWALSYLGAILPNQDANFSVKGGIITINIKDLGFNKNAIEKLNIINQKIYLSEEYKKTKCVDLGRYVCLLLGSSEHYFEIIETPKKLNDVLKNYQLLPDKGYVNNSSVSLEHRIIQYSEQSGFNQLFFCQEVDSITKKVYEYETIELLENGQLRFGIFDEKGNRKISGNNIHTNAGKPANCIWCHESTIQRMYEKQLDIKGFLSEKQLQEKLMFFSETHKKKQLSLTEGVTFKERQQHTLTELLYISFMEPSAERLSKEWNLSLAEVKLRLAKLPTHIHEEFKFLGVLYHRKDVDKLMPYIGLKVSGNVRKPSEVEVNYLR